MAKKYSFSYIARLTGLPVSLVRSKIVRIDPNYDTKKYIDLNSEEVKEFLENINSSSMEIRKVSYYFFDKKYDINKVQSITNLDKNKLNLILDFLYRFSYKIFILSKDELEYYTCLYYLGWHKSDLMKEFYIKKNNIDIIVKNKNKVTYKQIVKHGLEDLYYGMEYMKKVKDNPHFIVGMTNLDKMTRLSVLDELSWYFEVKGFPELKRYVLVFVYLNWNNTILWKENRNLTLKEWAKFIYKWYKDRQERLTKIHNEEAIC